MNVGPVHIEWKQRSRSKRLKEAVFQSFIEPSASLRARLGEFTAQDWKRAKFWLDVSGLALYFLDRLRALDLENCLPGFLEKQLRKDLADNRERTGALFAEAVVINEALGRLKVDFAFLKGMTLPEASVPDRTLRNQMDLDILVRDQDALKVQACLGDLGYELDAVSGTTWEFKAGPSGMSTLKNLYQVRPERALEVHLLPAGSEDRTSDRLTRARAPERQISALSAADIFVLQGQHLFKHMCGEHTRASWVLEFWRHVSTRKEDVAFWREVEAAAEREAGADIAIGAATLLATLVFGPFAPEQLTRWSLDRLPPAICLWIQLYGKRVLLSDTPGSKLYLLLRKQLNPHSPSGRMERRRLLFPLHPPQRITRAQSEEGMAGRLRRYRLEARFSLRRLRFHLAEGLRLALELPRWERRVAGVTQ